MSSQWFAKSSGLWQLTAVLQTVFLWIPLLSVITLEQQTRIDLPVLFIAEILAFPTLVAVACIVALKDKPIEIPEIRSWMTTMLLFGSTAVFVAYVATYTDTPTLILLGGLLFSHIVDWVLVAGLEKIFTRPWRRTA